MLFSEQDIDLLRLLRWCRYVPCDALTSLFSENTIDNLRYLKLLTLHTKSDSFVLTNRGNQFLDKNLDGLPAATPPSYRKDEVRRRLRVSRLTLTVYRAGVPVFLNHIESLAKSPSYYLTALSRVRGFNPWGSTRIAALLHLNDMVYALHYIFPDVGGLALTDELNAFNNNTAHLGKVKRGMIFAGESYGSVLMALSVGENSPGERLTTYEEAYRGTALPVYLLSCDDIGALQLRVMAQPDYRRRLTVAALKNQFQPAPGEHPEWDAMFQGAPFVMAADMDLRRIDTAIQSARAEGLGQIAMAALDGQAKSVLSLRYRIPGLARVFTLSDDAIASLGDMALYTPSGRQFETSEGGVIDAPLIQADRKGRGQSAK